MCALDGLHVQVKAAALLSDRRIAAVGQRARRAVAQAGDVVLVAAEILGLGLDLVRAVVVVDDLPDHLVVLHGPAACSHVRRPAPAVSLGQAPAGRRTAGPGPALGAAGEGRAGAAAGGAGGTGGEGGGAGGLPVRKRQSLESGRGCRAAGPDGVTSAHPPPPGVADMRTLFYRTLTASS